MGNEETGKAKEEKDLEVIIHDNLSPERQIHRSLNYLGYMV